MQSMSYKKDIVKIFFETDSKRPDWIQPITQGVMTHKFLVGIHGKKFIVRFYPKNRAHIVNFEPGIVERCRSMNIKVPELYLDSRSGPKCNLNYMVYEYIEGLPLSSQLTRLSKNQITSISGEIIEALKYMTQIRIEGFGELVSQSQGSDETWETFVENSFLEGISVAAKDNFCSLKQWEKLTQLSGQLNVKFLDTHGKLVYSDLRPENIIVTSNLSLASIIDFEGALSGDPLLSLGFCYSSSGDSKFFNALKTCWEEKIGSIDRRSLDIYSILRIMRIVKHLEENLPTGKPRDPLQKIFPGFFKSLDRI